MKVRVQKLDKDAIIPEYATSGAACFDLHVSNLRGDTTYGTGLAFEIPVFSRSGHGFKNGVRLANCVGVIDSDYRGEVCVKLHQDRRDIDIYHAKCGDRIAQAMIVPVDRCEFIESNELTQTDRGVGGFGSTGK